MLYCSVFTTVLALAARGAEFSAVDYKLENDGRRRSSTGRQLHDRLDTLQRESGADLPHDGGEHLWELQGTGLRRRNACSGTVTNCATHDSIRCVGSQKKCTACNTGHSYDVLTNQCLVNSGGNLPCTTYVAGCGTYSTNCYGSPVKECTACSGGAALSNNQCTCSGTVANCAKHDSSTCISGTQKCSKCSDGKFLDVFNNKCLDADCATDVAGCETSSTTNCHGINEKKCTECSGGKFLDVKNNKCLDAACAGTVAGCDTHSDKCYGNSKKECTKCSGGATLDANTCTCSGTVANCAMYDSSICVGGIQKCSQCKSGKFLDVLTNQCLDTACTGTVAGCETHSTTNCYGGSIKKCTKCSGGATFALDANTCTCTGTVTNCATHDSSQCVAGTQKCTACNTGHSYDVLNNKCLVNSGGNLPCTGTVAGCDTYSDNCYGNSIKECTKCSGDATLADNTCTCSGTVANCALHDSSICVGGIQKCSQCKSGKFLDVLTNQCLDTECTTDVAGCETYSTNCYGGSVKECTKCSGVANLDANTCMCVKTTCSATQYYDSTKCTGCQTLSDCVAGEYESKAPTATSDRECATCSKANCNLVTQYYDSAKCTGGVDGCQERKVKTCASGNLSPLKDGCESAGPCQLHDDGKGETVWAFCDGKPHAQWGNGTEGVANATANCNWDYTMGANKDACKAAKKLSGGAIFGIVLACLVVVGGIAGGAYYFFALRK